MRPNLTSLERDVRGAIVAPIALLVTLAFGITSVAGIFAFVLAVVMFITAFAGHCPIYDVLEIDRTQNEAA
jgi:presenilin-like A22 family membrane protease